MENRILIRLNTLFPSRLTSDLWIPILFCGLAIALVVISLPGLDLAKMNDLGLISVLPPGVFLSLVLIQASFIFSITRPSPRTGLIIFHFVLLIFMLSSLTMPIRGVPRFSVTWRHVGIVEYIMRLGQVDPRIDAYFNWPIFFATGALFTQVAGLPDILPLVEWAPLLYNLLYLPSMVFIFSTATQNRKIIWLAAWLFYLFNWIGQDYFSPQGLNIYLYLVALAIILRWFSKPQPQPRPTPEFSRLGSLAFIAQNVYEWFYAPGISEEIITRNQRRGLLIIFLLVFGFMVSSHQLTPLTLIISVFVLAFFNRIHFRYLPFVMLIMFGLWLGFPATTFIKTRFLRLVAAMGQFDAALDASVLDRMEGSPGHAIVVQARLILTLVFWGLGLVGGLLRLKQGYRDTNFAILAVSPFLLLGILLYGGEMLMRVYLFSLPFMAFFVSILFWQLLKPPVAWWRSAIALLSLVSLSFGFYLVRYGNERMDQYTWGELYAVQYLYSVAEPGSLFAGVARNIPFKYQDYEKYPSDFFESETVTGDLDTILKEMEDPEYPDAYLILTRSQAAHLEMFYNFQASDWVQLLDSIHKSERLRLIYKNQDAQIYALIK